MGDKKKDERETTSTKETTRETHTAGDDKAGKAAEPAGNGADAAGGDDDPNAGK